MPKPTGQTEAWNRGYDWADGVGPYHEMDIFEAVEAWGYAFGDAEDKQFEQGADFRQLEQGEEREFGDA